MAVENLDKDKLWSKIRDRKCLVINTVCGLPNWSAHLAGQNGDGHVAGGLDDAVHSEARLRLESQKAGDVGHPNLRGERWQ